MVTEVKNRSFSDTPIPPGELLEEELEAIGMSQTELAKRVGRPLQVINEIIRGRKRITHDTALELENVLGIPAHIWVGLETDFQLALAKQREATELDQQEELLKDFPVKEMERRNWIETGRTPRDKVRELLRFLGLASLRSWQQTVVGFRITPGATLSWGALAVWLRKGELEAKGQETKPYNEALFRVALDKIRPLTVQSPKAFVPLVKEMCAVGGVSVVFVPELPKSGASGAARWLNPDKGLIQLSLRYKTNDHLWLSFYHEACHILRHRIKEIHIDGIDGRDKTEEEADEFAEEQLIPRAEWQEFVIRGDRTRTTIEKFAHDIGIAPGIVVGRLQHSRLVPWQSGLNTLKGHLMWVSEKGEEE